jgi:hypothetical protein
MSDALFVFNAVYAGDAAVYDLLGSNKKRTFTRPKLGYLSKVVKTLDK